MGAGDQPPSAIENAARNQLDRLESLGIIGPNDEILVAAILALAHSMGISALKGQSVGLAQASKELREWYLLIPPIPGEDDPFLDLMRRMAGQT